MRWPAALRATLLALIGVLPLSVNGQGFAGKRLFPATPSVVDPFFIDELDLLLSHQPDVNKDDAKVDTTQAALNFSKRITRRLTLTLASGYAHLDPAQGSQQNGFTNTTLGIQFMGPISAERESVVAIGLDAKLGGTGSQAIDRDSFSTISPAFFLGQGFGNLPQSVKYLRPLAFNTAIAYNFPTRGREPETLSSGFALHYNLGYLTSFVRDIGLPSWLNHAIPVVEAPLRFCMESGCKGLTGTVNPGVIWFNHLGQVSVEASIPVNERTGDSVGMRLQLHLYMEDLFPNSLGKPLFD
ncbi:hypothetical protein [Nitrococcus mobilis]|uniref:Uncharacterized protein n=1 Tax=Nitrococcus mobilis Nb-231 TaxID=314278 RepID=A4BPC6_9GAMM|nr:hypothetical protein [Nitrococcus mobilis]EAR22427.1 hypothetical protein NB231_11844 [Nitrococcus mobilis Nb-231]